MNFLVLFHFKQIVFKLQCTPKVSVFFVASNNTYSPLICYVGQCTANSGGITCTQFELSVADPATDK